MFAPVAQLVEQWIENPRVVGSIPTGGTINAGVAHPVERHLAKVEVASSSLVARSNFFSLRNVSKKDTVPVFYCYTFLFFTTTVKLYRGGFSFAFFFRKSVELTLRL